ncbi:MAG TPA: hypothetical protein VG942_17830 [Hyphomonadaceae bacterium]|nr:hypothetical protein [Hyphomonadaceae bacterium]
MFDRNRIVSRNLAAARRFYAATARSLGLAILEAREDGFTLGRLSDMSNPLLSVNGVSASARAQNDAPETQPAYVTFEAKNDIAVRTFFQAALEAGGRMLLQPKQQGLDGARTYYAAQVADPDGNCIECSYRS